MNAQMNPTTSDIMNYLYKLEKKIVTKDEFNETVNKLESQIVNLSKELRYEMKEQNDNLVREIIDVMNTFGSPIDIHQRQLNNHEERITILENI